MKKVKRIPPKPVVTVTKTRNVTVQITQEQLVDALICAGIVPANFGDNINDSVDIWGCDFAPDPDDVVITFHSRTEEVTSE